MKLAHVGSFQKGLDFEFVLYLVSNPLVTETPKQRVDNLWISAQARDLGKCFKDARLVPGRIEVLREHPDFGQGSDVPVTLDHLDLATDDRLGLGVLTEHIPDHPTLVMGGQVVVIARVLPRAI